MHPADDDGARRRGSPEARHLQRITYEIGDVLNLAVLVIMGDDHRVADPLERLNGGDEVGRWGVEAGQDHVYRLTIACGGQQLAGATCGHHTVMAILADLALVRRERSLQQGFRSATATAAEGGEAGDQRLRLHVLVDRDRLGLARSALAVARAMSQFMHEQRKHEEVAFWALRHQTIVLLSASGQDMQELATYLGKQNKVSYLLTDEALDNVPAAAVYEPLPAMEGKVLFGRFAPLAL